MPSSIQQIVPLSTVLLCSSTCLAITDIESQRNFEIQKGFDGELAFSLSGRSGNSNNERYNIETALRHGWRLHESLLLLNKEYGESNRTRDTDSTFVHGRYIYHWQPPVAIELFAQYQDDSFQKLNSRHLVGTGLRWKAGHKKRWLALGAGAFYTREVFNSNEVLLEEDYFRGNAYLSATTPLAHNVDFRYTVYWQPRLSRFSDSYAISNAVFTAHINDSLSLSLKLNSRFDSDPVEEVEQLDHSYFTSIKYQF